MKEKQQFLESIETLLYSWGGDTPPEAIWTANKLIDWFVAEYDVGMLARFIEDDEDNQNKDTLAILENLLNAL